MSQADGKMEGWLYLIRLNRIGMQYSRKRYFVLEDNCLKSFKSIPTSCTQEPVRSAIIDSCIRVTDNGRESFHRNVFFIFTLCNTSDHKDQLKFGATSPEEAARWIQSLQAVAMNPGKTSRSISKRKWQPFRLSFSKRTPHKTSVDWTSVSTVDAMTPDVIAPSPWRICGCQNGLRMFREAKDKESNGIHWQNHSAIMAVGVVDGSSEAIFRTLMSLGPSRSEWDFCFYRGTVVEHLDGHTDIIHMQLANHWLPWGMKRRDLLLRRYWRREEDGTYVILYHSVYHKKCQPSEKYVRASLKSGGFVVTPGKDGKESVVKHMLAINWKCWKSYLGRGSERSITIRMLGRVAALRELFRAKEGGESYSYGGSSSLREIPSLASITELESSSPVREIRSSSSPVRDIEPSLPEIENEKEEIKTEIEVNVINEEKIEELVDNKPMPLVSGVSSLIALTDATDEFYDVRGEPSSDEDQEHKWSFDGSPDMSHQKLSSAAKIVKKLHERAVQKKGYMDLQEMAWEDNISSCYGATLAKDPTYNTPCSWAVGDPSSFLIRGKNYLKDHQKIKAKDNLMELVGADWLRSDKREDDLGGRPGSIVQKFAEKGRPEFFFIVNIQVPGTSNYNLALYYMLKTPLEESPLLESFVNGDDAFRNSRFKLIPYISKGSWIVKQSVGKKACLIGQALEVHYHRGNNYLEIDVDVGSSTVARGVVNLVLGYLNNLVIELAFLIQADTEEELPEILIGTCRMNNLDASKSVATETLSISG